MHVVGFYHLVFSFLFPLKLSKLLKEFDSIALSIAPIDVYVMKYLLLAIGAVAILVTGLSTVLNSETAFATQGHGGGSGAQGGGHGFGEGIGTGGNGGGGGFGSGVDHCGGGGGGSDTSDAHFHSSCD
jgi:hypothetical protein